VVECDLSIRNNSDFISVRFAKLGTLQVRKKTMDKLKAKLEELAAKKAGFDNPDFNVYDWSGGNYDDAYSLGQDDGEISLARQLLEMLS
jgi:hypothetical protein